MTVLDGVGDSFSGGDKDIQTLIGVYPCSRQPAAQGVAGRGQVADVGLKLQFQWGGMAVEQKNNVVLITAAWRETRHHLVRQIVQRRDAAVLNEGRGAGDAVIQCNTATLDQPIGVEQHGRARRHAHVRFGAGPVRSYP